MIEHLSMEQLLAVRDGDRSEPRFASAHRHFNECAACRVELDRLHQRTARLRALSPLSPVRDEFPAVLERVTVERRFQRRRVVAMVGLAAAAALVISVIGRDLLRPTRLDAEQQLQKAMTQSQVLEQTLHDWKPESRVLDGRTAVVVIHLEDKIADLDAQLADAGRIDRDARLNQELKLWQERVGLMNELVEVHLTRANTVAQ